MFKKLQQKWKVSSGRMLLILITFAIGGSLCGRLGKIILDQFNIDGGFLWVLVYILLVTLLWPPCVLLISVVTGQFIFFKNYLKKMGARMGLLPNHPPEGNQHKPTVKVAIFASGAGSNAEKIITYFQNHPSIYISLLVCNKKNAGVIAIAEKNQLPVLLINRAPFYESDTYVEHLQNLGINFIVLAGFLWKMPANFIKAYPNKIINIHPALLPKYGGEGMYGNFVHQAVIDNKETQSGISIHYVDEKYDHGAVIFQATCEVKDTDDARSLAERIHVLEHTHFAKCMEQVIEKNS